MGDPVGPDRAATELAWRFRELSDRHGGWACFYQVGPGALPRYLDMGLALFRLGEEAIVPLERFSLEGGERRPIRQAYHRALRDGLRFEVVPPSELPPLLPELRGISDAWLGQKNVREKGFSSTTSRGCGITRRSSRPNGARATSRRRGPSGSRSSSRTSPRSCRAA